MKWLREYWIILAVALGFAAIIVVIVAVRYQRKAPPAVVATPTETVVDRPPGGDKPSPPPIIPEGFNYSETTTTVTEPGVTDESAKNTGGSVRGTGDKVDLKDALLTPGQASLGPPGGPTASGGGLSASISAAIAGNTWVRWLIGIVGALMLLGGAIALKLGQPIKAAAGTIVIGLGLIACAFFPAFATFVLLGVALYACGSLWLTGQDSLRNREALRAALAGIADLKAQDAAAHKLLTSPDPEVGLIAKHADGGGKDLATIKGVNKTDDLPT